MSNQVLSEQEKQKLLKEILGSSYHSVGDHLPVFNAMIDGVSNFNDAVSLAELIPALSRWLGGAAGSVTSALSFAGVILFPVQQIINIINANETGLRSYSYRSIAYTITAWGFSKPTPLSSPKIISNLENGVGHARGGIEAYHRIWRETSDQVIIQLEQRCQQKDIKMEDMKLIFRALAAGSESKLSLDILKSFEDKFGHTTKHIWISGYKTTYPS